MFDSNFSSPIILPLLVAEDCEELVANMQRLKDRCEAVQIQVHTVRDDGQRQSLQKVNDVLQELQTRLFSTDDVPKKAVQQARLYLNACLPEAVGSIDTRFQSLVLGCALDDQKDVRRRLQILVHECNLDMESGSARLGNTNGNTATSESECSDHLGENLNPTHTQAVSAGHKPPSSGQQEADGSSDDSATVENYRTAQWHAAPKVDRSDDSDLSVSQQEGESIEELNAKDSYPGSCTHSHQPHFDSS